MIDRGFVGSDLVQEHPQSGSRLEGDQNASLFERMSGHDQSDQVTVSAERTLLHERVQQGTRLAKRDAPPLTLRGIEAPLHRFDVQVTDHYLWGDVHHPGGYQHQNGKIHVNARGKLGAAAHAERGSLPASPGTGGPAAASR